MTKNPSRKLWEVWILIIPQAIRIHFREWEVVVCCPRRGMRMIIPPGASDPNIILEVWRVPMGSSSPPQPEERSEDTWRYGSRSLSYLQVVRWFRTWYRGLPSTLLAVPWPLNPLPVLRLFYLYQSYHLVPCHHQDPFFCLSLFMISSSPLLASKLSYSVRNFSNIRLWQRFHLYGIVHFLINIFCPTPHWQVHAIAKQGRHPVSVWQIFHEGLNLKMIVYNWVTQGSSSSKNIY